MNAEVKTVVWAKLPVVLSEKCAKATGFTQDECYNFLLTASKEGGVEAVQTLVDKWGVKWTAEPREFVVAPKGDNGIRVTHKEEKSVAPSVKALPADITAALEGIGVDIKQLDIEAEISEARKYRAEQEEALRDTRAEYGRIYKWLSDQEQILLAQAKTNAHYVRWHDGLKGDNKKEKVRMFLDNLLAAKCSEQVKALEVALLAVKQAQAEIEACDVTIENLTQKGGE